MSNPKGHAETLVASHPDNAHAARHGLFSRTGKVLQPRAQAIADELMTAPHMTSLDRLTVEEIGRVLARIEALDDELDTARGATRKTLLEIRLKASRELRTWLKECGLTPRSRAEFAKKLAEGGLMAEFARRQAQRENEA